MRFGWQKWGRWNIPFVSIVRIRYKSAEDEYGFRDDHVQIDTQLQDRENIA